MLLPPRSKAPQSPAQGKVSPHSAHPGPGHGPLKSTMSKTELIFLTKLALAPRLPLPSAAKSQRASFSLAFHIYHLLMQDWGCVLFTPAAPALEQHLVSCRWLGESLCGAQVGDNECSYTSIRSTHIHGHCVASPCKLPFDVLPSLSAIASPVICLIKQYDALPFTVRSLNLIQFFTHSNNSPTIQ